MTLASCLFIAVINILLSNYIAQPILRLKRLMQEAASGNLDIEIPKIDGQVEIMSRKTQEQEITDFLRVFQSVYEELTNVQRA